MNEKSLFSRNSFRFMPIMTGSFKPYLLFAIEGIK